MTNINAPSITSFNQLIERAKSKVSSKPLTAAILVPLSPETIAAVRRAANERLIHPLHIGPKTNEIGVPEAEFIEVDDMQAAVHKGLELAAEKKIDFLIQGDLTCSGMLESLFGQKELFIRKGGTVSHVAVMKPSRYPKLLMLSDGAIVIQPDLGTKLQILANMARVASQIGLEKPRIAVVGAVEAVYPQMPATLDGAVLAKMFERGQIKGLVVDGPLSFDVAVDMFAATAKGVTRSEVAGQADGFLASNIEVANGIYNAMSLYGDCDIGGIVVGGQIPVAVNSAADGEAARFHSIVLGVLCS